jgi:predicted nucleotidyltransferase
MKARRAVPQDLLERCRSEEGWKRRLNQDAANTLAGQDRSVQDLIEVVVTRSRAGGAEGVALTGSTARGHRTAISDVDFLVVGPRPRTDDLTMEVDLRALTAGELMTRLEGGEEYVQWALRFGCILYDQGIFREASRVLLEADLWPDPERKRRHARTLVDLAARILESGDRDATEEAVRGSLTAVAHWILLSNWVFPLSRDELSDQILDLGSFDLAAALHRSIHSEPGLDELATMLRLARHALDLTPRRARRVALPTAA